MDGSYDFQPSWSITALQAAIELRPRSEQCTPEVRMVEFFFGKILKVDPLQSAIDDRRA